MPSCIRSIAALNLLTSFQVTGMEVVSDGELIRDRQGGRREDFFLFLRLRLLLLLFEQFLFLEALAVEQDFVEPLADVFKLEVCSCHWACVFSIVVFFGVDAFVVCEVNIVNVFVIALNCCHLSLCLLYFSL